MLHMLCSLQYLNFEPKSGLIHTSVIWCAQNPPRRVPRVQNSGAVQETGSKPSWVWSCAGNSLKLPGDTLSCPPSSGVCRWKPPTALLCFYVWTQMDPTLHEEEEGKWKANEQEISKANCFLSLKGLIRIALTCFLQCKGGADVWIRAIYAHLKIFMML